MNMLVRLVPFLLTALFITNQSISQKAKYQSDIIFYLSHHVQWPERDRGYKFVIGVIGTEKDYQSFQKFALEKGEIQGRPIEVRYFECTAEISDCHIVYISEECKIDINDIVKKTKKEPVLLISGKDGYGRMGSVINFVDREDKLRIELNEKQAMKRGLKISNGLKALAILI